MAGSTKKEFVSGVAYTAVTKYAGQLIQLAIMGVLSRLLLPEVFGIVTVSTVLINFFAIFSDMGLGPAIIQHKELTGRDLDNIFSFSCWTGIILSVLFVACSPLIAGWYNSEQLVPVCMILSVNLLFSSINIVPNALIFRDKKFKFIARRTIAVQIVTGVLAIVAAYALPDGYKIYAMIVQPVVSAVVIFAVNYRAYPVKLHMTLGLDTIKHVFSYSAYQFMFSFINYFSRNFDKLALPKYLDMAQLGYYDKSYRLMMLPLQNITSVLTPVMHPVFSDMQHNLRSMMGNYMKIVRLLAFIGFPASVVLMYTAPELTLLIFGPMWGPSVPAFRILAVSVGVQVVLSSSGSIFQAAGDTRTLFISGFSSAILNVAGMVTALTVYGTIEALAWAIVITFTINFVACYILMFRLTFKMAMGVFWRQFISPILLTAILLAAMWPATLLPEGTNMFLSLGIKCLIAALVWLPYIQFTGVFDIVGQARKILNR